MPAIPVRRHRPTRLLRRPLSAPIRRHRPTTSTLRRHRSRWNGCRRHSSRRHGTTRTIRTIPIGLRRHRLAPPRPTLSRPRRPIVTRLSRPVLSRPMLPGHVLPRRVLPRTTVPRPILLRRAVLRRTVLRRAVLSGPGTRTGALRHPRLPVHRPPTPRLRPSSRPRPIFSEPLLHPSRPIPRRLLPGPPWFLGPRRRRNRRRPDRGTPPPTPVTTRTDRRRADRHPTDGHPADRHATHRDTTHGHATHRYAIDRNTTGGRTAGRRRASLGRLVDRCVHGLPASRVTRITLARERRPLPGDLVDPRRFVVPAVRTRPGAPTVHRAAIGRPGSWQLSVTAYSTLSKIRAVGGRGPG